ncbi:MAG TPA: 50S ribosomal protein L32 [bacterium]|nr:50S ribosomal protein L32 [bacterium]
MAHPKHRKSHSKTRMGRSHHGVKPRSMSECPNCRQLKMPHRVCPNCGFYKRSTIEA